MAGDNTLVRSIHDLTQAAWFGGALMGAIAIDAAAKTMPDEAARVDAANAAWTAWQPVSTAAIATHLLAGLGMTYANKGRLAAQPGALRTTMVKTGLTFAAVALDAYARRLGAEVSEHEPVTSAEDPTAPAPVSDHRGSLRRKLKAAQWGVVGLTGAVIVVGAQMGEQQRPRTLVRGIADRLGLADRFGLAA